VATPSDFLKVVMTVSLRVITSKPQILLGGTTRRVEGV